MSKVIYEEVAVIFERGISNLNNNLILRPVKVALGNMNFNYGLFIDEDNNSYFHISETVPGNVYGLRTRVSYFLDEYKTNSLERAKELCLRDLKKYEYSININSAGQECLIGTSKARKKIFFEDIDLSDMEDKNNKLNVVSDFKRMALEIKREVIGQDEAIDKFVVSLWINSQLDFKRNMIIMGPSGVGKTDIIRYAAKMMDRVFYKTSATEFSEAGYVDRSVTDILEKLLVVCNYDVEKAEGAIVVLDEFDKIATSNRSDVSTKSVQQELLTLIEDGEFFVPVKDKSEVAISTKGITFIGVGSFDGITKKEKTEIGFGKSVVKEKSYNEITSNDLINFGLIPEIVGRMPIRISLKNLSREDIIEIMHQKGLLQDILNILAMNGIDVYVTNDAYYAMADMVLWFKVGARAIDDVVSKTFFQINNDVLNGIACYNYIEVTADTVKNPSIYVGKMVNKKGTKKRVKK